MLLLLNDHFHDASMWLCLFSIQMHSNLASECGDIVQPALSLSLACEHMIIQLQTSGQCSSTLTPNDLQN